MIYFLMRIFHPTFMYPSGPLSQWHKVSFQLWKNLIDSSVNSSVFDLKCLKFECESVLWFGMWKEHM
jgi:hypothetical protein